MFNFKYLYGFAHHAVTYAAPTSFATEGSLLGDRRKYPCGIRGMSLKTKLEEESKGFELGYEFSSPCGAVRRSTYLASGNEFKNKENFNVVNIGIHSVFVPPTNGSTECRPKGAYLATEGSTLVVFGE